MALTGTLKDFGIAEILQLIGTQKKTGVLTLEDQQHRAEIYFFEGMVVGASGGTMGVSLEERLVKSGFITEEQRAEAERKVKETLKPFTAVLLTDNLISPRELREVIALHISEIVYETFGWKSGTYAFEQKFIQWDRQLVTPMSAESLMMDGLRIVDESPAVMKAIPSMTEVYAPVDKNLLHNKTLGPETEAVLNLLDGQRTVQDVILRSRLPRFDVLKHLAVLLNKKVIAPVEKSRQVESPPAGKPVKAGNSSRISVYVLTAVTIIVTLWQLGGAVIKTAKPYSPREGAGQSAPALMEEIQLRRIKNALEAYNLINGKYPATLELLSEAGFISSSEIKEFKQNNYKYEVTNTGYTFGVAEEEQ